jgi:ubiquinone/menaquinone biosynthesis C-methylase UbiE
MTYELTDARFWDKSARKYAAHTIKDMVGYERTLERTGELLSPYDRVLEIGCGTGTSALKLASQVRSILATDLSSEMIGIARTKAAAAGQSNVSFAVAPADTDFSEAFDAVLAFNLLHLVSDRQAVLRQAFVALKPGGYFVSKTPCLSEMNPLIRLAVPLMRAIGQAPQVAFFDADDLEQDIERVGFSVIERGRHGTQRNEPRIFIVARKPSSRA